MSSSASRSRRRSGSRSGESSAEDVQPVWLAVFASRYPVLQLAVCFIVVAGASTIIALSNVFEMADNTNWDYLIRGNEEVAKMDEISFAQEAVIVANAEKQPLQSIPVDDWLTIVLYAVPKGSDSELMTAANLKQMRKVESVITDDDEYDSFCLLNNGSCVYSSVTDLFDGTKDIDETLEVLATVDDAAQFFDKEFDEDNPEPYLARSFFIMGGPIKDPKTGKRYRDAYTDTFEQFTVFKDWVLKNQEYFTEEASTETLEVIVFSWPLFDYYIEATVFSDLLWTVGSMIFVGIYIGFHTGSTFLAFGGIIQILFSFPLTFFIYRFIANVTFFQSLHILSIFIILGIGADDIFVIQDAWSQSALAGAIVNSSLELRLSWVYRRAASAVFATSFTTAIAFMATAFSPMLPISTFGVFSAILVVTNYGLCMMVYPPLLILWHKYNICVCTKCPCCAEEGSDASDDDGKDGVELPNYSASSSNASGTASPRGTGKADNSNNVNDSNDVYSDNKHSDNKHGGSDDSEHNSLDGFDADGLRRVERFFYSTYIPTIQQYRYVILAVFGVLFVLAVVGATFIGPSANDESLFPANHPISKAGEWLNKDFSKGSSDERVVMHLYWGVDSMDTSEVDRYDAADRGTVVWDEDFDIRPPAAQEFIRDTCTKAFKLGSKAIDLDQPQACFMEDFAQWREDNNETFPVPKNEFVDAISGFLNFSDPQTVGFAAKYGQDVGLVFKTGKIRYIQLSFSTPVSDLTDLGATEEVNELWGKFMKERNAAAKKDSATKSVDNGKHTGLIHTAWLPSAKAFATNAIQGVIFSMVFAFIVLTAITLNVIVSAFATLTVAGIVCSDVALMVAQGWSLGIVESIAIILVVGFSIDYVVHLAHAYVEAETSDRFHRTRFAATTMGVSVVAGGATTLGSSLFLWGCVVTFFGKFAILILMTVLLAQTWSLGFFLTLMVTAGPEGELGSLKPLLRAIGARLCNTEDSGSSGSRSGEEDGEQSSSTTSEMSSDTESYSFV